MAVPTVPDWLTLRDGGLRPGLSSNTVLVLLGGRPEYRLDARPAGGQFVCNVTQTVNGRQLGSSPPAAAPAAALAGGLDLLREKLGW